MPRTTRAFLLLGTIFILIMPTYPLAYAGASSSPELTQKLYSISQYQLPAGASGPAQVASDSVGRIWFVEQGSNQIGSFDPTTDRVSEFNIPTAKALPEGIAIDRDGTVWFAELTSNGLGHLFPGNGTIREVTIPTGTAGLGCGPIGVTPQGNGSIWITCEFSNQIDEYVPAEDTIKVFELPIAFSAPLQILFDTSGNFWFAAADAGMLGHATVNQLRPGTSAGIEEFAPLNNTYVDVIENPLLPSGHVLTSLAVPSQLAFSSDGRSLWISEHGAGSFDRYDISTGSLTKYFTSTPLSSFYQQSLPNGISVDGSGEVWVAEHYGNRIAEFNPTTGTMTEYPIPCCGPQIAGTLYLTPGANGTVWFTENSGNALGELKPIAGSSPIIASVSSNSISLDPHGDATVKVEVTPGAGGAGASQTLNFEVAGVTRNGNLMNLTASFQPGNVTIENSAVTSTLNLQASGLKPGVYYLTVGGKSSSSGVISSAILEVTVFQGFEIVWVVAIVAVAAAVAVLLVLLSRRGSRGRLWRGMSTGPR